MTQLIGIQSYGEVLEIMKRSRLNAKAQGKRLLSNFFPNPALQDAWISTGALKAFSSEKGEMLLHAAEFVDEAYFFITDEAGLTALVEAVPDCRGNRPLIIEQVGNKPAIEIPAKTSDRTLLRFCRTGAPESDRPVSPIDYAAEEDIEAIREIFLTYFDPVTDRLPSHDELHKLVSSKSILVRRREGRIVAFLVYELSGSSIHLRYWWSSPDFRNCGLGSELMRQFFERGKDTKRQYLWVDATNENAIKRYRHFGFQDDGVYDYIQVMMPKAVS